MEVKPNESVSSLNTTSSRQSSIKDRYFQYDVLAPGHFRLFKLDLNEEDEPLSGALLTMYNSWNALDFSRQWYKTIMRDKTDEVLKSLTGEDTYDSFSYVWGSQTETQPLHLSLISKKLGQDGSAKLNYESYRNGTIQVGSNLEALLKELRRRKHKRFVWIDAICINQANDLEKKMQIPMMGSIYEYAGHGYIWLGTGSNEEVEAVQRLHPITEQLKQAYEQDMNLSPGRDETFQRANLPEPHEEVWKNIGLVMRHPYWSRIWTLQEAVVPERTDGGDLEAFPPTEVFLGETTTQLDVFNQFSIVATNLGLRSWIITGRLDIISRPGSLYGFDGIDEIRICRQSWGSDLWGAGLRALLLGTRRRKATVPEDVIYGMLGMMDRPTAKELQPTANASTQDVFIKFAKYYIRNEIREHLLNHVATEHKMEGLPSWCPNFASSPATMSLGSRWTGEYDISKQEEEQMYHAGYKREGKWKLPKSRFYVLKAVGNVMKARNQHVGTRDTHDPRQIALVPDSDYLLVSGMHIDVVAEVVECNPAAESFHLFTITNLLQTEEWDAQCLKVALRYLSRDVDGFDTYTRTITANKVRIEHNSGEPILFDHESKLDFVDRYRKFKAFIQAMKAVRGDMDTENLDREAWHYGDVLSHVTCRRRFFATEGGRIGLGPAETEVGDTVAVLFYCPTPYILRHSPSGRGQFIGEAYVHGIMYGEALDMLAKGDLDETKWVIE